ncbi:MFS transporter [Paenibacillus sp. NAIST15-1]|uniref:MFS transporter n=1 Tax=Paenibacillus sp. NAIST15-1 TaxID=1605994 RepID=UPI00086F054F|nr:MFS transporter [Paenibacillus sp. NAIST15-1]GAV10728.1 macrolide efflux pump [Paenibacillus sp. NAIST15-1]
MLLRHKAFRQLFAGRVLSVFADSILFFSLLKWIEIKSSGTESFTFFYVAYYLPIVLLALPAGAWISGKTLQHVMVWSNVVRMSGMILFFLLSNMIPMPWVYALLISESIVGLFFMPASQSLLPQIVSEKERPSANSWLQMGYTVVKITGQIFTAFMLKNGSSPASLLLFSAFLLLCSLMCIMRMKPKVKQEMPERRGQWTLMKEGVLYIARHRQLGTLFVFLTIAMFIASSVDLILLSFLRDVLGSGVENLSFIGTASLSGMIVGAALVPKWYKKIERKWLIVPPFFTLCISIGSLYAIQNWLVILPLFFVQGIALGCFNITFVTYVQDIVEKDNYTRVFSMYHMISTSAALPGILLTGVLLSTWGVTTTVLVISGMLLILGIAGILAIPSLGKGNSAEQTNNETVAV